MRADDDWHQVYLDSGYIYCRPEDEYHRPPECTIDAAGFALAWCGCRWTDVGQQCHRDGCTERHSEQVYAREHVEARTQAHSPNHGHPHLAPDRQKIQTCPPGASLPPGPGGFLPALIRLSALNRR